MRKFPTIVDKSFNYGIENHSVWKSEPNQGIPPIKYHGHGFGYGKNTPYKYTIGDGLGNGYKLYPHQLIQYWK